MVHDQETPETKRIKQTISIPFLWEEKPGTPKLDYWKRVNPVMQMSIKLIASVPFQWEEKPGTPLPDCANFSHHPSPDPPNPPKQLHKVNNPFCDSDCDLDDQEIHDQVLLDQYSSSLNHHQKNPFCDSSDDELEEIEEVEYGGIVKSESDVDNSGYLQAPSSPAWETESIASSYATTGTTTTLAGSLFLECMFPLLTPQSSFFETVGCSGIRVPPMNSCIRSVSNGTTAGRKPLTLGELILMSRRRSYLKKAVESHENNYHSTELMVRNAFGCCNIDAGGLNKLKRQLKLI